MRGDRFFRFLVVTTVLLMVFIVAVQIGIHQGRALATSKDGLEYRFRLNLTCEVAEGE